MKNIKKIVVALLISSCITLSDTRVDLAITKSKENTYKEEKIKQTTRAFTKNSELYKEDIEELKKEILKKAKLHSKTVNSDMIDLAFKYADDKSPLDNSVRKYFKMVAIHLAIMEIESNFDNNIVCNNLTTKDYGIMQVNTQVIPTARKELYNSSLDPYDLEDNVCMGSWEIYECYKKAKRKHPDKLLWYTYAYYNRGLYFENYNYNYDEADQRSRIFIKSFYKYFNILYNS